MRVYQLPPVVRPADPEPEWLDFARRRLVLGRVPVVSVGLGLDIGQFAAEDRHGQVWTWLPAPDGNAGWDLAAVYAGGVDRDEAMLSGSGARVA